MGYRANVYPPCLLIFKGQKHLIDCKIIQYNYILIVCYYHVTYVFESDSTLYSCLNINELLAQNRHDISSLSDSGIRSHLVHTRTLNHLAKLVSYDKWLSVCLSTKCLWIRIPLLSLIVIFCSLNLKKSYRTISCSCIL